MKHFLWSRVGVHYRADEKYKKCLGNLCFKGQLQADSLLVELIFILLSLISQGDSLITCKGLYAINWKLKISHCTNPSCSPCSSFVESNSMKLHWKY